MPRIQCDGHLLEIEDCPGCGATALCQQQLGRPAFFRAACGRRLINGLEARAGACLGARCVEYPKCCCRGTCARGRT